MQRGLDNHLYIASNDNGRCDDKHRHDFRDRCYHGYNASYHHFGDSGANNRYDNRLGIDAEAATNIRSGSRGRSV